MQYSRELGFDETPDYSWLRGLFLDVISELDEVDDGIYDWQLLNGAKGWQSIAKERRQPRSKKLLLGPPPLPPQQQVHKEPIKAYQTLQEPIKHHKRSSNNINSSTSRSRWSKVKLLLTCGIF